MRYPPAVGSTTLRLAVAVIRSIISVTNSHNILVASLNLLTSELARRHRTNPRPSLHFNLAKSLEPLGTIPMSSSEWSHQRNLPYNQSEQ